MIPQFTEADTLSVADEMKTNGLVRVFHYELGV